METSFYTNVSPGPRRASSDAAATGKEGDSLSGTVPDPAVSSTALRSMETTPDKDERRSSARASALSSMGPVTRCSPLKSLLTSAYIAVPELKFDSRGSTRKCCMDSTGMPTAHSL